MVKIWKFNRKEIAKPPGTLIQRDETKVEKVRVNYINYNELNFREKELDTFSKEELVSDETQITWIDIIGTNNVELLEHVGKEYSLHPLILEDIISSGQRPKLEDYGNYLFIVLKVVYFDENKELVFDEVDIVLGTNFVLSFQEGGVDVFTSIKQRIKNSKGRIRRMEADYLAYALIDIIIDNNFIILEKFGETIEEIEERLVTNPSPEILNLIHQLKRELIFMRKSVWPLRELLSGLQRRESLLIKEGTLIYLRDVYAHTIQIIDTIESFRDMVSGMLDIYLSSLSNRMNEIMKVLTIIATIFIPLTFIVGIYGMNFLNMPELGWTWGYPLILIIMGIIGVVMIMYFKMKKWL